MNDSVLIAWTPTNWLTIFLMALGGFVILKLISAAITNARGGSGGADSGGSSD